MRDPRWRPGYGSPDTSYGKRVDPADQQEPEPQTLSDMVRQRQRERLASQSKRTKRGDRT